MKCAIYEVKVKTSDNLEFLGQTLDFLVIGDIEPAGGDAREAGELVELLGVEVGGDHRATLLDELEGGGSANSYRYNQNDTYDYAISLIRRIIPVLVKTIRWR